MRALNQLCSAGDIRAVGTNNDNGIAALRDFVIAGNDRRERGLCVGVNVFIRDANTFLIREVDAVVPKQELHNIIRPVGHARNRAEDAHFANRTSERGGNTERHRRLAEWLFVEVM